MPQRRRCSPEYKQEAVQLAQQSDSHVAKIPRNLRINENLLRRWVKQITEPGKRAFPGHGHPRGQELARLQKELRQVKKERDLLREAATFFAKESKRDSR